MQAFLVKLITSILGLVFKGVVKGSKDTLEEGAGKGKLERRLRSKIKKEGW